MLCSQIVMTRARFWPKHLCIPFFLPRFRVTIQGSAAGRNLQYDDCVLAPCMSFGPPAAHMYYFFLQIVGL